MGINILSWNIRGFRKREKKRSLRTLIQKHNPCLLFVQESKVEILSEYEIRRFWNSSNLDFVVSPAIGSAGGLFSIWNSDIFTALEKYSYQRFIVVIGTFKHSNFFCGFINVYAPSVDSEKTKFLEEL
ncbi:hypothetical protein HRI_003501800 [Hibiscus trionum]|uniref:Endonuclease/exonuclease/phosphatase domain-containing protein n=1 Tax=Hibiscus trionum TaxID=183268 RepID=A0A9W7ILI5_HIBTR|nr:hypothetical protein HRI_003501800 [Hibiscus trionum]